MNIKKKCKQINSLLGDLSSTGIKPIPDIVYEMRTLLERIESIKPCPSCSGDKFLFDMDGIPVGDCTQCNGQGYVFKDWKSVKQKGL